MPDGDTEHLPKYLFRRRHILASREAGLRLRRRASRHRNSEQAEEVAQAAFAKARDDASKYVTLDRLLLALLGDSSIARVLRSMDARVDALRAELHAYVDASLVGADGDDLPQPTRALNRVMQMAVAKARSSARHRATALDLLWALCGERDVPTADLLDCFEIARPGVAERMG